MTADFAFIKYLENKFQKCNILAKENSNLNRLMLFKLHVDKYVLMSSLIKNPLKYFRRFFLKLLKKNCSNIRKDARKDFTFY